MNHIPERRRAPRKKITLIVYYCPKGNTATVDISQARNMSTLGMCLNTGRKFDRDMVINLDLKLPFAEKPFYVLAMVKDSTERVKDIIYETRLEFMGLEDKQKKVLEQIISFYQK